MDDDVRRKAMITNEMKEKLFEIMLKFETEEKENTKASAAFEMLDALGLGSEYIAWAIGK